MPKIIPSRIKAQFELEDEYRKTLTQSVAQQMTAGMADAQTQKLYHSVKPVY